MRQSPTAKRGRGRSGGRRPYSNPANRSYDSSGPDVKIRGTASHIYEKYQTLARDASASGDRVAAENYLQHAEHYFRIISANNAGPNHGQTQSSNQQQGQPDQQPQPTYQADGGANGRGRGNGQRMDASGEAERHDDVGGVIRTLSRSDEGRTIEPATGGPTSFEPVPDDAGTAPAGQGSASTGPQAESKEDGGEPQRKPSERKKTASKEDTDTATAG